MNNEEKMLELLSGMQTRLGNIDGRLDKINEKLDSLAEDHAVTREGVNTLIEWADRVAVVVKMPLK